MLGILITIIYAGYVILYGKQYLYESIAWVFWILSAGLDISWLFFGVEEFKVPTIRSIITKLIGVGCIFLFVKNPDDVWIYCLAISGSYLLNQILLWPFIRKYIDYYKPKRSEIVRHIKPNLILFIPVIATSLYTSMNTLMLGWFSGMDQVGLFDYSQKITRIPLALITSLGTVMMPRMTKELQNGSREKADSYLQLSLWCMLGCAFLFMWGIIAVANEFVPVFFGAEFAECVSLMSYLSLTIPIVSLTNIIGRQYMIPSGSDKQFTLSLCIGACGNIIAGLLLIPNYGAKGAVASSVLAEFIVLVVQICMTRKSISWIQYVKKCIPFFIIGLATMLITRFGISILSAFKINAILNLIIEILFDGTLYCILFYIYCSITKNNNLKIVLGVRLSKRFLKY
jgi:O-antigen/teichoic acid export membrane protein